MAALLVRQMLKQRPVSNEAKLANRNHWSAQADMSPQNIYIYTYSYIYIKHRYQQKLWQEHANCNFRALATTSRVGGCVHARSARCSMLCPMTAGRLLENVLPWLGVCPANKTHEIIVLGLCGSVTGNLRHKPASEELAKENFIRNMKALKENCDLLSIY